MTTQIQRRRGTTAQHSTFTGAVGEVTVDTDKEVVVVHDGVQVGGYPAARENLSNVPAGTITSTMIADGTIINADVNASAAIAGTKISPNFGSQNVTTTGTSTAASFIPTSSTVPTNGVYLPAANSVAISTAGSGRLFVDSSGIITQGSNNAPSGITALGFVSCTNTASGSSYIAYKSADATNPVSFNFSKSRGTNSSPTSILANDNIGSINFNAYNGTTFAGAGSIAVTATGISGGNISTDITFTTANAGSTTEKLRITSAGLVGVGVSSPGSVIDVRSSGAVPARFYADNFYYVEARGNAGTNGQTGFNSIVADGSGASTNFYCINAGGAGQLLVTNAYPLQFFTNNTERARIDSSGRLLVGTSSARSNFYNSSVTSRVQIAGTGAGGSASQASLSLVNESANSDEDSSLLILGRSFGGNTLVTNNARLGVISFQGADGSELIEGASVAAFVDGTSGANDLPTRLVFSTTADGASSPTERMRIGSNGFSKFSNTGSYLDGGGSNEIFHEFSSDKQSQACLRVHSSNASFDGYACLQVEVQRNTTNDTFKALRYYNRGAGTERFVVADDGDVRNTNNSYAGLSDIKLKENIIEASSQWDDLKALQVRKYNFKPETGESNHTQIGLIAQEVELVSPGLVSESPDRDAEGNDLGTVTKSVNYSVLYMKAVKALQEAMERIETLEAKVAALESA